MIAFIDAHRVRRTEGLRWGVEPICKVLQVAPSSVHARRSRPLSDRAVRDAELVPEIRRVHDANYSVYGVDKVWSELNREQIPVARCPVERLIRQEGIRGVAKGKAPRTTIPGAAADRPDDLVKRQFTADAPDRLWVADITYVRTFVGWVYVAFIIDVYSRFIVGWQASRSLRTDLALDALDMAIHLRRPPAGIVHHNDRGVQYTSIRYTERLADAAAVASIGSKGDSYDNAMAESFNSLYKAELIHNKGPWRGLDDVEFATLEYVDWFNHRRLHGSIGMIPPAEFEALNYNQPTPDRQTVPQP